MSLDVDGNDNSPEWGWCKAAEGCREEAFPVWKSGDYPDDPDLLLCPKHLGLLIGQMEADAAALRKALDEIDHQPVGAYETDFGDVEPCDSCGEMRTIAENALRDTNAGAKLLSDLAESYKANRKAATEIARLTAALRQAARMFTIRGARKIVEDAIGVEP